MTDEEADNHLSKVSEARMFEWLSQKYWEWKTRRYQRKARAVVRKNISRAFGVKVENPCLR